MGQELIRDYPFEFKTRSDGADDGLTLEGYAAVFDSPTVIDSWEGRFTETVARGAFQKTIQERAPVLMFNHGQHPLIGDMPIGVFTHLREDDHGLFVRARLADNWLIQPVRDAIANRSVKGMSFRFAATKDEWNKARTQRVLREVSMPECGPVVFPAYDDTSVGVRSREALVLLSDPEVRTDLAAALMADGVTDFSALRSEAAPDGTSDTQEPPVPDQEPARATPVAMTKADRLKAVAQLKGYIK